MGVLTIKFHDNDFGAAMQNALSTVNDSHHMRLLLDKRDLETLREVVIALMAGYSTAQQISYKYQVPKPVFDSYKSYSEYFQKVELSLNSADADVEHNGEWCSLRYNEGGYGTSAYIESH